MELAVYLRKSRADEGADLETTLHRHSVQLHALAKERGDVIVAEYREVVSGDSLYTRPEMLRLLEQVQAGAYEGVLCMDLDRLGRGGMRDQGIILDAFRSSGTRIITPDKVYDLEDDMDDELAEFKTFFARRELKMIKKRLSRGRRQTIENGGFLHAPPYGYRKTKVGKLPSLEPVEEEANFVRMMFTLYVEQRVGCTIIAETVDALGARPHRGEHFNRTTVMAILKNPVYIGKIAANRVKLIPNPNGNSPRRRHQPKETWLVEDGLHPPIVSQELFDAAQAIIAGRAIPSTKTGAVRNPLSGLVHCGQCGRLMQLQAPRDKTPYLLCTTKGCVAATRFERVEAAILGHMRKEVERLEAPEAQPDVAQQALLEKECSALVRELDKTDAQRDRLHDLLEQGVYDITTFQQRMSSLNDRRTLLEAQMQIRQRELQHLLGLDRSARAAALRLVLETYSTSNPGKQNQLLKSVFRKIIYYRPKKSTERELALEFEYQTNI